MERMSPSPLTEALLLGGICALPSVNAEQVKTLLEAVGLGEILAKKPEG